MRNGYSHNSYQQLDSRRRALQLLQAARQAAHKADYYRTEGTNARNNIDDLEMKNPDFANAGTGKITGDYVIALAVPVVICLDFWLFGALAEFLVGLGFNGNRAFIWAAKILLPILIVWLELKLSTLLFLEKQQSTVGTRISLKYLGYLSLGAVLIMVMPLISIATSLAASAGMTETVQAPFDAMMWALAALALGSHALVLFGGQHAFRAKAHIVFTLRRKRFSKQVRKFDARVRREINQFATIITEYMQHIRTHNSLYPDAPIDHGPFDQTTLRVANEIFGYQLIRNASDNVVVNNWPTETEVVNTSPNGG